VIPSFNPGRGLIVIGAELDGPSGSAILRLALDTGATSTLVNVAMLVAIGYDPALAADRVQVTTGSGVEFAPRIELKRLAALGQESLRISGARPYLTAERWSRWTAGVGLFSRIALDNRFSRWSTAPCLALQSTWLPNP
jgi:hypothetical protein